MVASKRVSAHGYLLTEVDVTGIRSLRTSQSGAFERRWGTKLTFMPFFVLAAAKALGAVPIVNASVDGADIVVHRDCNIGIAVAVGAGLLVPVIKRADEQRFSNLAWAVNDLAERARTKKLKADEVAESTFSITNPAGFGGLFGFGVLNQPNVAMLGMGKIEQRPVVRDDAIAIRSMIYLSLSYDYRAVDDAAAQEFMSNIKRTLQDWTENIL